MAAYWAPGSWRVGPLGMPVRLSRTERVSVSKDCQRFSQKNWWFYKVSEGEICFFVFVQSHLMI